MKKNIRGPFIPEERHETLRHQITTILTTGIFSAREISSQVGIPEKEVYEHLEHIRKSMEKKAEHLTITPAECAKCGFVFSKREKLRKPGKCPVCKGEQIQEPLFFIKA